MQPIPHGWRLERQDIMYVRERLDFGYKKSQDFHLKKKKKEKPVGHELETCYYFNEDFYTGQSGIWNMTNVYIIRLVLCLFFFSRKRKKKCQNLIFTLCLCRFFFRFRTWRR